MFRSCSWLAALTVSVIAIGYVPEAAATAVFAGSRSVVYGGTTTQLDAEAKFTITGNTLTILLTNTVAAHGGMLPRETLSGLYFNITGANSALTPVSATVDNVTGMIVQDSQCYNGAATCNGVANVGGEFSYYYNATDTETTNPVAGSPAFPATKHAIGSAQYLDGNNTSGNFGGSNLDGPGSNPNTASNKGLSNGDFGMVPLGFVANSGNTALIAGTVKFVLNLPSGLSEADIKDVHFTYGTSDSEMSIKHMPGTKKASTSGGGSVPEPMTFSMLGLALAGAAYRFRRRTS